jgi:uncharacterized protein YfbU (UPF0304 family)
VKLTKVERWILANQYKILEQVDPDNAEHYQTMQEILEKGYETEYRWKTQHIYDDDDVVTEEKGHYVINVLAMYDALQQSYQRLADKEGIDQNAFAFPGFDGNNEGEYLGYARFLRDKEEKFTDLQVSGRDLNSHFPTLDMYNRMQNAWAQRGGGHEMSRDDINAILTARIHPDNR